MLFEKIVVIKWNLHYMERACIIHKFICQVLVSKYILLNEFSSVIFLKIAI